MYEVDHVFVCVEVNAPEADLLVSFGITEGEPNVHPGQGTANRRFFFHNTYLELLWVSDPIEAQSEVVGPTQLWSRWSQRRSGASPFGVALRPVRPGSADVPFPCWEYRPAYLPSPAAIHIAQDVPLSEPFWCFLEFGRRPDALAERAMRLESHAIGFQEVTHLRISGPLGDNPSAAAVAVSRTGAVALGPEPEHLMEMTFDGASEGRCMDFRPAIPLVFRW
jgi:hypothetical protein